MSGQIRELGRKVSERLNSENGQVRRRWQAIIGVTFMAVFVVASVAVNQTVLALNKAAGNYGYVSNTYGYNASATSSDQVPSAPTSLSTSGITSGQATLAWTAPTTTTDSTSLDNLSQYNVHYGTSSLSSCSGGSTTTSTSAGATLTSLSASTTYYVAVCAQDSNSNTSSALTGSFTTANASTGGGGGGGASIFTTTPDTTTVATTPAVTSPTLVTIGVPTSATAVAQAIGITLPASAIEHAATLLAKVVPSAVLASAASAVQESLKAFIAVGPAGASANSPVMRIGAGERASLIEAFLHSQGRLPTTARDFQFLVAHIVIPRLLAAGDASQDLTKLFSDMRNLTIEGDGLKDFTNCNGRPPSVDAKNVKLPKVQQDKEWAFVKYTGYQLKVDPTYRSLGAEAEIIKKFKRSTLTIYKDGKKVVKAAGVNPKDIYDWNFLRGAAYSGAPTACLK